MGTERGAVGGGLRHGLWRFTQSGGCGFMIRSKAKVWKNAKKKKNPREFQWNVWGLRRGEL